MKCALCTSLARWLLAAGAFGLVMTAGERGAFSQESGSVERDLPRFGLPFDPQPAESGSSEKRIRLFPRRIDSLPGESGSQEKPVPFFPPGKTTEPTGKTVPGSDSSGGAALQDSGATLTSEVRFPSSFTVETPHLLFAVALLLVGFLVVAWMLFRMGLFNPYTAAVWPKRLELCLEIALRMDDFLTAFREGHFEKCQMSLDALNHLNGRRSIILSNPVNAAVNRFVEQAVDAKVSHKDESYQAELSRRYEIVIEALRVATRQEELTLEVLRSLTKAQGEHRRLRETTTEKKS